MRKYGGHYKINGPPVNVPATLDHIVEILPRMLNDLQLHPLKLKRKLEYKGYYMYDVVRKDKGIHQFGDHLPTFSLFSTYVYE